MAEPQNEPSPLASGPTPAGTTAGATIAPGTRVRITQQIAARHYAFQTPVEGVVISAEARPTGSWFAHGEADKLWLDRIVLRKDDGEVSTLNLDEHSRIERLG